MKKFIIVLCLGLLVAACGKQEEPKAKSFLDKATEAVTEKADEVKAAAEKAKAEADKAAAEAKAKAKAEAEAAKTK